MYYQPLMHALSPHEGPRESIFNLLKVLSACCAYPENEYHFQIVVAKLVDI